MIFRAVRHAVRVPSVTAVRLKAAQLKLARLKLTRKSRPAARWVCACSSPRRRHLRFDRYRNKLAQQLAARDLVNAHETIKTAGSELAAIRAERCRVGSPVAFAGCDALARFSLINGHFFSSASHRDSAAVGRKSESKDRAVLHFEFPDESGIVSYSHGSRTVHHVQVRNSFNTADQDDVAAGVPGDSCEFAAQRVDV